MVTKLSHTGVGLHVGSGVGFDVGACTNERAFSNARTPCPGDLSCNFMGLKMTEKLWHTGVVGAGVGFDVGACTTQVCLYTMERSIVHSSDLIDSKKHDIPVLSALE